MNANIALQDRFLDLFFSGPLGPHFYLTGGTALARFYFQHRESLDLDLFTNHQEQDFAQVNQIILSIVNILDLQITNQVSTDTFIQYIVTDQEGTPLKVDLVKDVPTHFGKLRLEGKVQVDSPENIGSNKVLAGQTQKILSICIGFCAIPGWLLISSSNMHAKKIQDYRNFSWPTRCKMSPKFAYSLACWRHSPGMKSAFFFNSLLKICF